MLKSIVSLLSLLFVCGTMHAAEWGHAGNIETRYNQTLAHFRGNPYEMGYQHGTLLKEQVNKNIERFVSDAALANNPNQERLQLFGNQFTDIIQYIPHAYIMEMIGLADGAQVPFQKVLLLNLFPEMFHCSGAVIGPQGSKNGNPWHVRTLDYNLGKTLEDTAVIMVFEPDHGLPFVSVSYAGFIGVVTGMNMQKISVGEIGGQGYGEWEGMPMSFLLRQVVQYAQSLDDATSLLSTIKRTCEYYYVVTDGKTKQSCGYYATPSQLQLISPGSNYAIFAPTEHAESNKNDKQVHTYYNQTSNPFQTLFFGLNNKLIALAHQQPSDCLILTGFSKPERYTALAQRIYDRHGKIGLTEIVNIVRAPVCADDNLHNAIFSPSTLEFWVAMAGNGLAAYNQSYINYHLDTLVSQEKK